jgi:hypothetical protein
VALVDPRTVFFSEQTQVLNNQLPQWHAGRRKRTSNWAQLTNRWLGMQLEDYKRQEILAFRNQFLQTAFLGQLDIIQRAQLPQGVNLLPRQVNTNGLANSAFFNRARPDRVADYWNHSGTVTVGTPALAGATSVALEPTLGTTSRIYQEVKFDAWTKDQSRTFSAWYRIASWAGGVIPATSHGLIVFVTHADGTTATFRAAFAQDTGDKWRRITLSVTPTKDVATYEVRLETARSGAFDISVPVRLDMVQAQQGTIASSWEPNLFDRPNWFFSDFRSPLEFDTETPVYVTDSLRDFDFDAVPTRVQLLRSTSTVTTPVRQGGAGVATDFFKQEWVFTWEIDTTTGKIRKVGVEPKDIYAAFDISFFTGTGDGPKFEEDVAGLTYRSIAAYGRWLFVVHEMVGLDGNPQVVLSVLDPLVNYPSPSHLESKLTIPLPLPAGVDYHIAEFRLEDPQHLYINSPTTEFVLRLKYDYAMLDTENLQAFFRERYNSLALLR